MKKLILPLAFILSVTAAHADVELRRQRNVATVYVVPIYNVVTGQLVTGAVGLDTECTKWDQGGTPGVPADATAEATELGSSGYYSVSLTQTEIDADYAMCITKSTTGGSFSPPILFNTKWGVVATNSAGGLGDGSIKAATFQNNSVTSGVIADDALTVTKFAPDNGVQSGSNRTIVLDASETYADHALAGQEICIVRGTGKGQCRTITDNAGATDTVTIDEALTTSLVTTASKYVIGGRRKLGVVRSGAIPTVQ